MMDIKGFQFGDLTVLGNFQRDDTRLSNSTWEVRCVCGTIKRVRHYSLLRGETTSCGCWRSRHTAERMTKHGFATRTSKQVDYSGEYRAWMAMRSRCRNPNTD